MRKIFYALTSLALTLGAVNFGAAGTAFAATEGLRAGKTLYAVNGKKMGVIYNIRRDGSIEVIKDGKLSTYAPTAVSLVNGKAQIAAVDAAGNTASH